MRYKTYYLHVRKVILHSGKGKRLNLIPVRGSILSRHPPMCIATHRLPSMSRQWPSGRPSSFSNVTTVRGLLISPVLTS